MLPLVPDILRLLQAHPLVQSLRVVEHDETPFGKLVLKVRCRLVGGYRFQLWLHHESAFQNYAYQLFTDRPLLRWDNAPHHAHIATEPHHFHDAGGAVNESPLTGDPLTDLPVVLQATEAFIR